ncbi:MAG: hypothetical protein RI897_3846 [Verrucomicrobiota bacterium]
MQVAEFIEVAAFDESELQGQGEHDAEEQAYEQGGGPFDEPLAGDGDGLDRLPGIEAEPAFLGIGGCADNEGDAGPEEEPEHLHIFLHVLLVLGFEGEPVECGDECEQDGGDSGDQEEVELVQGEFFTDEGAQRVGRGGGTDLSSFSGPFDPLEEV